MSWEQLWTTIQLNREEARRFATEPPVTCPHDGTLLDVMPNGNRHCPFGNYFWNGQRRIL